MQIPEDLLAKISEFSSAGFFLVNTTQEGGLEIYDQLDGEIISMGVRKHLENYIAAHNELGKDCTMQNIMEDFQEQFEAQMKKEAKDKRKRKKNGQNPDANSGAEF